MLAIFHNFIVPLILGLSLTALKIIADRKDITLDEANGIALDLVLVSIGALIAFYMKGRDVDASVSAAVGDVGLAVTLLVIRNVRAKKRDKLIAAGSQVPEVGVPTGIAELLLGVASIIWTVKAF